MFFQHSWTVLKREGWTGTSIKRDGLCSVWVGCLFVCGALRSLHHQGRISEKHWDWLKRQILTGSERTESRCLQVEENQRLLTPFSFGRSALLHPASVRTLSGNNWTGWRRHSLVSELEFSWKKDLGSVCKSAKSLNVDERHVYCRRPRISCLGCELTVTHCDWCTFTAPCWLGGGITRERADYSVEKKHGGWGRWWDTYVHQVDCELVSVKNAKKEKKIKLCTPQHSNQVQDEKQSKTKKEKATCAPQSFHMKPFNI